jgi:hypothetical protein
LLIVCRSDKYESASGGTVVLSLSLISQNRYTENSDGIISHRSHLSRHRPDAQAALQQSLILQDNIYKLMNDEIKIKAEVFFAWNC